MGDLFEKFNLFRKMEKPPTREELEAAKRAAEIARREKEEKEAKEKPEREKWASSRARWKEHLEKTAPPYVITEEEIKKAEEKVGKGFEKLEK